MSARKITITATIAAPVDKVWQAYSTPADITGWNFASDDWSCPSAEVDLRVGGKYRARMEAKDGSFGFDFDAVYEEVAPPDAVTLVLSDGRQARTTFEVQGVDTKVTTVFDADEQNSIDLQQSGWQAILDSFKKYVESKSGA